MAKHDQRILKFLTQNAERAPTITDMMTRLNISISDISASLNSLMAQGLVSKRTNGQGIECWFPTNGASPQLGSEGTETERRGAEPGRVSSARFATPLGNPAPPEPAPLPPLQPTLPSLSASTAFPASLTATSSPSPLGPRNPARESAVFSAATANPIPAPFPPMAPAPIPAAAGPDVLPGVTPPVGNYNLAPVRNGIGFITFAFGLILTAAASVYFSGRLLKKDFDSASRNFVEKPAWDKAMGSMNAFETATKTHVRSLEAEVKALTAQVAAMKTANDSLQAVAAKQAEDARKAEAALARKGSSKRRR